MTKNFLGRRQLKFYELLSEIKKEVPALGRVVPSCWHPVFGFDVIQFCESLEVAGAESCRDRVAEVYGQKGVEWIKRLIGLGMELLDEEAVSTNE